MRRLSLTFSALCVLAWATAGLTGCQPELGDAPFLCNPGSPRCPSGYQCNGANVCVKEGTCPAGIDGCPKGGGGGGTCGDGKCEGSETCSSCEKDCGKCAASCGDGKCDSGETCTSCEQDCGKCPNTCTTGETKCLDKDTLQYCDQGTLKTDKCATICTTQYDYAVGCRLSTQTNKDICLCGNYAKFGEVCDSDIKCATGLFCGSFGSTTSAGFCSKYCSNPGGVCTGGPIGSDARCILNVNGQNACGFDCKSILSTCPTGLTCDFTTSLCKPR